VVPIPVIDLFAGPGGLGEGFATLHDPDDRRGFRVRLSIEKDFHAHQTLMLRAFYRQFSPGRVPGLYYDVLRGTATRETLFERFPDQAASASAEAWHAELGVTDPSAVRDRIRAALGDSSEWVLIGGPPCQAYSVAGRSRNKGVEGYRADEDKRQYLYTQYLEIIADHWPAIFVMENVKGLLSATLRDQQMFERIHEDLSHPARALKGMGNGRSHRYTIHSVSPQGRLFDGVDVGDFVVPAERHGIPQARHRVILVGVRDDFWLVQNSANHKLPMVGDTAAKSVLNDLPPVRSGLSRGMDSDQTWLDVIRGARAWVKSTSTVAGQEVEDLILEAIDNLALPTHRRGAEFIPGEFKTSYESKWFYDGKLEGVCNHFTREHMPRDLHRYLYAACFAKHHGYSPRLRHFPSELLPEHKNVNLAVKGHGFFGDRFRVQVEDHPSTTITSHLAKDGHGFIHPDPRQCRSLTVREAARLQTFPDNYAFCGPRSQQCVQVGNAVPPLLAKGIARIVSSILNNEADEVLAPRTCGQAV
jgi:DNA (cytosine-5)-methyltransferase 1